MAKTSKTKVSKKYDHKKIEKKWQEEWKKEKTYSPDIKNSKKPFYNLMMFPYPSAEGLHVGNMYAFTGADVFGRFHRMQGYDVLEPIGLDGFGIHSENYAIKVGRHPMEHAKISEENFYKQLHMIGNGFDWDHKLETYDSDYYKWTQWLFVKMFKNGLAYKDSASVNWCPSCKTVLADEQVLNKASTKEDKSLGEDTAVCVCERCGTEVERREMSSWFFKITDYADRLLENIEKIDWPEKIKIAQRQWIGKSKGLTIDFKVKGADQKLSVWTKFWETVYGVTFIVVSPEYARDHLMDFVPKERKVDVEDYVRVSLNKSEQERAAIREKSGVLMGISAVNPVNGEEVPVFVADYVLAGVGTGAVMGVPAHDERDFAFAKKYELPIRKVVDVEVETHSVVIKRSVDSNFIKEVEKNGWYFTDYEDWGWGVVFPKGDESKYIKLVQSSLKDEPWFVDTDGALKAIIFKNKVFELKTNLDSQEAKEYALDMGISKNDLNWDNKDSYIYCHEKGGLLVNSDKFDGLDAWGEGKEKMADWMIKSGFAHWETNYHLRDWLISRQRYWGPPIPMIKCEKCGWQAVPEEDLPVLLPDIKDFKPQGDGTSPLHNAPDSWKKVICPKCGKEAARELDVSDTFLDSSWYFLRYPSVDAESSTTLPFDTDITKKWLPVNAYIGGAEHAVLHLLYARFVTMFLKDQGMLSFEEPFPFLFGHGLIIKDGAKMSKSKGNIVNPDEYIEKFGADALRTYLMFLGPYDQGGDFRDTGIEGMSRFLGRVWRLFDKYDAKARIEGETLTIMHRTINAVGGDISKFKYNTAISKIMELVNHLTEKESVGKEVLETLLKLLAPFAPHMTEQLWRENLGNKGSVHLSIWPKYNEKYLVSSMVSFIVQVNGKLRSTFEVDADNADDKNYVIEEAKKLENVSKWLEGGVKKEIFVPGKIVNFVV